MSLILRLPQLLLEWLLRRGLKLIGLGEEDRFDVPAPPPPPARAPAPPPGDETAPAPRAGNGRAPAGEPSVVRPGPPPPSATEALRRSREREAAAAAPPPAPDAARPAEPVAAQEPEPEPERPAATVTPLPTARDEHVDREAEVVESVGPAQDVGAVLTVQAPWDGYDGMSAAAVVSRLQGADATTRAMVRLYEGQNKARRTVLAATGT